MANKADRQLATSTAGADRTEMSVADMGSSLDISIVQFNCNHPCYTQCRGVDFERLPSRDQNRRSKMNHELS